MAPLHCCCRPGWSFHGAGISKMLGCLLQLGLHFQQPPLLSSPHSVKYQLLSTVPSCLQNQYYLGDCHTLRSPAASMKYNPDGLEHSLCPDMEQTLPRRLHLNAAGLLLITANSWGPANQHPLSEQTTGFTSGILVITPHSSAQPSRHHSFFTQMPW